MGLVQPLVINFPDMKKTSWVVLNALDDVLGYMFEIGDDFFSDTVRHNLGHLQHLNDQFSTTDGVTEFDGDEEEHMAFSRDPYGAFLGYQKEMETCMIRIAESNDFPYFDKLIREREVVNIIRYNHLWVVMTEAHEIVD